MDCIKNPFVFGVLAAITVYGIFYWKYKKDAEKDPSQPKKKVSYLYPLGAAILAGLFAHFQFPQRTYRLVSVSEPVPMLSGVPISSQLLPLPEIFLDFGTF